MFRRGVYLIIYLNEMFRNIFIYAILGHKSDVRTHKIFNNRNNLQVIYILNKKVSKVKLSRCTPWRHMGGEEV
jgi:hypothetical protein